MNLRMNLSDQSYDIVIEKGILEKVNEYILKVYANQKVYIITDSNVEQYYLKKITNLLQKNFIVDSIIIPAGEESKSIQTYQEVVLKLLDKNIRRNELLIALGGGVVGDLTGFVASTIYRGIPYLNIPTSLLAQMDSSIGGKTGIDFDGRKNIIGAFKQPLMVLIDPLTLNTLSKEEFDNGMGELIKHAAIGDKRLFEALKSHPKIEEEIIYQSLLVKKSVVEQDEFDQGMRMILNFGHTFGHIIELEDHLKHGVAVSNGMLMAIAYGIDLKLTNPHCYDELKKVLLSYDIEVKEYDYKKYLSKTIFDKKNLAGTINFIFIKDFGDCFIYKEKENEIKGEI